MAGIVADALAGGIAPDQVLVLARTGFATEAVQRALTQAGIAHRVLGSLGMYERAEVREALAYLTLLANPADAQAFRRAIAAPRRGVGTATAARLVAHARDSRTATSSPLAARPTRSPACARPRYESESPTSAKSLTTSVVSCAPGARSATSSSPR